MYALLTCPLIPNALYLAALEALNIWTQVKQLHAHHHIPIPITACLAACPPLEYNFIVMQANVFQIILAQANILAYSISPIEKQWVSLMSTLANNSITSHLSECDKQVTFIV